MKILRTTVLRLIPLVLVLGVASPSHAQDTEAFLQAAALGDTDMVRLFIGTGQSVNTADSAGNSVLMFAAGNGQAAVVEMLIEAGADVNLPNVEDWTPLMMAALRGHLEAAAALVNAGADVHARADIGMTPLIMAAASGQAAVVGYLLENGASVEDATPDERTALITAAEGGYAECVDILLEHGADPNAEARDGFTALVAAHNSGETAVVWSLVEAGAVFTTNAAVRPELLSNPELNAPDSLDAAAIEGSVVIQFIVDVEGKVEPESVEIIESPHEGLNEAVTQLFLGAVYKPAEFDGKPVRMRIRQSMSFGG